MKLGRKNLIYSVILAGIMLLFLVGYFIYMLPSLYVDYVTEQNLKAVKEQHKAYVKNGTYEGVQVRNPSACVSIEIPDVGESILVTGKAFSVRVTAEDEKLKSFLRQCREFMQSYEDSVREDTKLNEDSMKALEEQIKIIAQDMEQNFKGNTDMPISLELLYVQDMASEYESQKVKFHMGSDNMIVIETGVEDSGNQYTNYIAMERTGEGFVFSMLPVMTPDMNEIRPVVLGSLPMLGAVILLLVLLFSQVYSNGIVAPIVQLVQHTERMKYTKGFAVEPISGKWKKRTDEVGELADTLEDLYAKVKESYRQLEEKNNQLMEENRRQEIFLRASSHQLKTPISAALLLVDGMINEIGKYKNKEEYLPKVKEQLLSMRKMVEDILYLNHCGENIRMQQLEVRKLLEERLQAYQVAIADKQIRVEMTGRQDMQAYTDEMMITQILDNLLSNAVKYTPMGENIQIQIKDKEVTIENHGVTVSEEILPHIFDPFVSGNHGTGSHGLGLYIASYYAKKIGVDISIYNEINGVVTKICFREQGDSSVVGNA